MNLTQMLLEQSHDIVEEACGAMARSHARNYDKAGPEHIHQRIKALYVLTQRGVKEKNLGPMIAHADAVARERFGAGYDLWEVQTAFNVLEEVIWTRVLRTLAPVEYGEALGLVSTVLGAGKDTLARRYVTLASKAKAPSLNLQSLFTGIEG